MVKKLPAKVGDIVRSLSQEDSLEKECQPTPVLMPGKSHGQRRLQFMELQKSQTQLSD